MILIWTEVIKTLFISKFDWNLKLNYIFFQQIMKTSYDWLSTISVSETKLNNSSIPTVDKIESRSNLPKHPSDVSSLLGFLKVGWRFVLRLVETLED